MSSFFEIINSVSIMKKSFFLLAVAFCLVLGTQAAANATSEAIKNQSLQITNEEPMKIAIIIETKEYEKAWNAFRFATVAKEQGYEVKVFLMGEGVECVGLTHDKYNVDEKLNEFVDMGGTVLACGTCLRSRNLEGSDVCPMSNMLTCVDMVAWADKTVTF